MPEPSASLVFGEKLQELVHLVAFSANCRYCPTIVESPDNIIPNRPFREEDRDLILPPEYKGSTSFVDYLQYLDHMD